MIIKKDELIKLLNKNIANHINKKEFQIISKNPFELFSSKRFDLVVKHMYSSALELGTEKVFAEEVYCAHIKAFNGFVENDGSGKIGKDLFLKSFNNLHGDIKTNGLSDNTIIPLSKEGIPLDGAHRIAISSALGKKIKTVELDTYSPNYNFEFFKQRGLDEKYLDAIATEYAKLKNNVFVVIIWPSAEGKERELQKILNNYGSIIYRKNIKLENYGPIHLIKQTYKNESWVGSPKNGFIGAQNKARWCFEKEGEVRAFLFESNKDMIKMKKEVRSLFNIKKHAVHINDTKEETLEIAGLLFNKNSIHWMNNARIRNFPWFNRLFNHYKKWLSEKSLNSDYFCIDGSSTLAAYGIREVRDLDYLQVSYGDIKTGVKEIGCHNNNLDHHPCGLRDIIFNPNNYVSIDGIKFTSLDIIEKMKNNRGELKDKSDIESIKNLVNKKKCITSFYEEYKKLTNISYWKGRIKFLLLKIRYFATIFIINIKKL